jgi:hypothetical protein
LGSAHGVSLPTLQRLEAGDPGVGIGIVVTALWLIQRDGALAQLAAPELDQGAIELDIRQAQALGRARAQAAALSRSTILAQQCIGFEPERFVVPIGKRLRKSPFKN